MYLVIGLIYLLAISIGSSFHLWGGSGLFLPVFVILSAIGNNWKMWLIWLIAYLASGFFLTVSIPQVMVVILLSVGAHFLFSRWMSLDDGVISWLTIAGIIAIFVVLANISLLQPLSLHVIGSYLLTTPIAFVWFRIFHPPERRLK